MFKSEAESDVVVENAKLKSRDKLALGAIVILGLVFRIFLLLFSNTIPRAIGSQKIIQACLIKMDILSSVHEANPPIYLLLLKFFMYIFSDQLFVPRVISLVFGVGTIFIFFLSVKIISDCRIALLASLVLALAPLHAFWSIFSTEDAIFIFFIFTAIYFFLKYQLVNAKVSYLLVSAVFLSVSFGLRFEAIVYILFFPILLVVRPLVYKEYCLLSENHKSQPGLFIRSIKIAAVFFVISASFLFIWFYFCWFKWGDPLISFTGQSYYASIENSIRHYSLSFLGDYLIRNLSLVYILLAIVGFFKSIKNPRFLEVNVVYVVFVSSFFVKIFSYTLLLQQKYLLSFFLFFIIYGSVGFFFLIGCVKRKALKVLFVIIVLFFYSFFLVQYSFGLQEDYKVDESLSAIVRYLSSQDDKRGVLVDVDYYHLYPEPIVVLGGLDRINSYIPQEVEVVGQILLSEDEISMRKKSVCAEISKGNLSHILYFPEGRSLKHLFPLYGEIENICGFNYTRVVEGKDFFVYKMND